MKFPHRILLLLLGSAFEFAALGGGPPPPALPPGYIVLPDSLSPDHHYGVTAYDDTNNPLPGGDIDSNKLIDVSTGRVLAAIDSSAAMTRMNHGGIVPSRWSPDGSLLLWEVEGKWGPDLIVLLEIKNGTVMKQVDLLTLAQKAILIRTRKASPDEYKKAKAENAGNGSAYPEGFTVDAQVDGPISFPLHVRTELTSNPKGIEGLPTVESHLEGVLDEKGVFKVTQFQLGHGQSDTF
jgi:hypothetical protein